MMKKRILTVITVGAVSFSTLAPSVHATSLNNQMNDVKNEQNKVEAEKQELQEKLKATQASQAEVEAKLKELEVALTDTKNKISAVYQEMHQLKAEIEQLQEEIIELEKRIQRRTEILKNRLVSIQKSGGRVSMLEVLLGADSFANLVDRLSAVSIIMKSDQDILREQELDQAALKEKKDQQTERLASVEKKKAELDKLNEELQAQSQEQQELMEQLKVEEKILEEGLLEAEEEARVLAQQEETIKKAIEEEKKRQEEEEKKRQEEEKKQQISNNNTNSSNSNNNSSNSSEQKPSITTGTFMRPTVGPATSEFGPRWGTFHYGIDIGKRGSNVQVVAAADGIVSNSYFSSSYGNVVFITHYIDGKVYTTVYSHLENRAVSTGQRVNKGDFLGYMGNTGISTGPHLHFEIHEGEWNNAKSNAVNPRKYINF